MKERGVFPRFFFLPFSLRFAEPVRNDFQHDRQLSVV
jgi:hypothetical protein